jgi:hypothetical protein
VSINFRFQRAGGFNLADPIWHVTHRGTGMYVGEVHGVAAGNFEVRRPSESMFHGTHATKVQAARWLKNTLGSSVLFEDDVEREGDESAD